EPFFLWLDRLSSPRASQFARNRVSCGRAPRPVAYSSPATLSQCAARPSQTLCPFWPCLPAVPPPHTPLWLLSFSADFERQWGGCGPMDWVHAEAAPRFPGEVPPLRPVESAPGSASSVLPPAQQRALPEPDTSWATQGGSSQGLGWQAASSNLAGWQAGAGSPRDADSGSGNAPPAGVGLGLAGKVDVANANQLPSPPLAGSPAGSLSLPPAAAAAAAPAPPQGGVAPRLSGPPSYSSVAVFGPADGGVGGISVTGEQSAAASSTASATAAAAATAVTATATTASAGVVAVGGGILSATLQQQQQLQQPQQQQQQLLGVAGSAYPAHPSPSPGVVSP
ncbi:unnamed protein product, partial [Laminaria digitata]